MNWLHFFWLLLGYFIIEEQKRVEKPKSGAVNFIPLDSIDFFFFFNDGGKWKLLNEIQLGNYIGFYYLQWEIRGIQP